MKNIILVTIDALRKDVLGCYGNKKGLTPFIDSIQGQCIRFTKAQAIGPYTQASFPGILTSSYYLEQGAPPQRLSSQKTLISEALKDRGILTAGFHSNPYLCGYFGWNRGWDVFMDSMQEKVSPENPFLKGDKINTKVEEWLSSRRGSNQDRPFFLWVHYMDVHEPYIPQRKYLNGIDSSIDLSEKDMLVLFKEVILKRDTSDPGKIALLKRLYDAHVKEADEYVGELFGILKKLDLLETSSVFITSDHGDEFNEHGGLSHEDKMYSELIDIPLLLFDSKRDKLEECRRPVSNIDIPPTIMHLFGLERPQRFEGRSLLPAENDFEKGCFGEALHHVRGKGGDIGRDVYFYREGDLKVIYRGDIGTWEMYDLEADQQERVNIVDQSSEAERLQEILQPRIRRWTKGTEERS